ncbi:ORF18 [Barthadenovirus mellis]|uniref:ORF18 n=1 Tax=Passerine adenovirus 1 TaxID=2779174 RepID=A0A7L9DI26_9ADEN|nr:ORF18 [Passerine adenovirus 1]
MSHRLPSSVAIWTPAPPGLTPGLPTSLRHEGVVSSYMVPAAAAWGVKRRSSREGFLLVLLLVHLSPFCRDRAMTAADMVVGIFLLGWALRGGVLGSPIPLVPTPYWNITCNVTGCGSSWGCDLGDASLPVSAEVTRRGGWFSLRCCLQGRCTWSEYVSFCVSDCDLTTVDLTSYALIGTVAILVVWALLLIYCFASTCRYGIQWAWFFLTRRLFPLIKSTLARFCRYHSLFSRSSRE